MTWRVHGPRWGLAAILACLAPLPAGAQPVVTRVMTWLESPRGLVLGPEGALYVIEAGRSGAGPCTVLADQIWVRPFPDVTAAEWKITTSGGTKPLWARDGRELFYVSPNGAIMSGRVAARRGTWGAGTPTKLVEGPYEISGISGARTYDVSPDGQRFLVVKPAKHTAAPQIIVWQSWVEKELKRLVPVS